MPKEHDLIEKWKFDEVLEQLSKVIDVVNQIDKTLFHFNHEVSGFHLNGDNEPIMNFVEDFDMDCIKLAEEILSRYELKKSDNEKH